MVRFSSNLKRPRTILKQTGPVLSKEAPPISNVSKQKPQIFRPSPLQQGHIHTRSLPSDQISQISIVQEFGLTSGQAIKKLIEEIDQLILSKREKERDNEKDRIKIISIMRYFSLIFLSIRLLWKYQNFHFSIFYLIILFLELLFIELIEKFNNKFSVSNSMKGIRNKLRKLDKLLLSGKVDLDYLYSLNFKVPISTAISYVRVLRDGKMRLSCLNLIVPGDFVVLLAGEKVSNYFTNFQTLNISISSTQRKNLGIPIDSKIIQIEEFPVTKVFQDQLRKPRRNKFIFSLLQEKFQIILSIGILLLLGIEKFIDFKSILIPLFIISSPILRFLWWLISTCYISLLFEQLIKSETPFNETTPIEDVDEFDEDAPPPVKNIKIPSWKVIREVLKTIFGVKKDEGHFGILRILDGDIVEALALTSVLCFTDREGPIANAHSRPCELIIPTRNELELVAIELIPTISDSQKVRPSLLNNLSPLDLRAIGLSMLLSTNCERSFSDDGPHCRHENVLNELCHFLPEHFQTCYCNLAKEIGFDSSVKNRFKMIKTIWHQNSNNCNNNSNGHKKTSTVSILVEDLMTLSIFDLSSSDIPLGHLFTFGEVSDILKLCSFSYSKEGEDFKIMETSESLKRKLIDFDGTMRSCDVNCVSFCYRPIFRGETNGNKLNEILLSGLSESAGSHVFLGLISVSTEPKEHFQEFIDDLEAAGVRFAYFSPYREQPSKAFGERLGLETDWNSCILLSEHPNPSSQSTGYSSLSDIKTRLPRGIQAIRPHLESVDDIPLHVSIFAECNSTNSAEMIKIYQESGEIVTTIGSCRSIRNSNCFSTSHLSIGYDPLSRNNYNNNPNSKFNLKFDQIALDINSNSVKLILPSNFSPYIITELIRESRTILQNTMNAWEYVVGSILCLILTIPTSSILTKMFAVFLIGITIILGPHDPFVMKTHSSILDSSKCVETVSFSSIFNYFSLISIIRFIPSFLALNISNSSILVLLIQSVSFIHSHERFNLKFVHLKLKYSLIIYILVHLIYSGITDSLFNTIVSLIISIILGLICVTWNEFIKSIYLKDQYEQSQKRSKLLFNTKLGMHSPV